MTREQRIFNWLQLRAGRYVHEAEIYWGVFIVDGSDTRPIALFNTEDAAQMYADDLTDDEDSNTEYDVSPAALDITHRDNCDVPA